MTIDEAIKKCEYGLYFTNEQYDELQAMLEELKELRKFKDEVEDKMHNSIDEAIKAIDDILSIITIIRI